MPIKDTENPFVQHSYLLNYHAENYKGEKNVLFLQLLIVDSLCFTFGQNIFFTNVLFIDGIGSE